MGSTAAHSAASFAGSGYYAAERAQDLRTAVELLRLISAAGGDLGAADEKGYTPFHTAVMGGRLVAAQSSCSRNWIECERTERHKGETPRLMLSITSWVDGFAKMKLLVAEGRGG